MINRDRKLRRKKRVSSSIIGTPERPRVSIYKSSKYIYAQVIDDTAHNTIAAYSTLQLKKKTGTKTEESKSAGAELGAILVKLDKKAIVFDRGANTYMGRVAAFAEGIRSSGIIF
jgi:large subunit ribosomal protein L18